ncbi:MAG: hypothetical protein JWQ90_3084 [Hydrocarboniphaga sp.]|uniref:TonB-dependent receptor n=1 Tax=Hydrocarboniphaga sp. TaxID=2033016 RepID=UPI002613318A|nr:TonB-dependent receptor plug domain-containing protein [Hydrocarboniphaga sp.]MDB5970634.1 hypothetical protein [Hydrocarboniphaga sp.]
MRKDSRQMILVRAATFAAGTLVAASAAAEQLTPADAAAEPQAPMQATDPVADPAAAAAPEAPAAAAAETGGERQIEEIVVTARRKAENLQVVPTSITAFSEESLRQGSIQSTNDLQFMTPGVVFTSSGSAEATLLTIRGQSKSAVGSGLPGVVTYLNDVPMPTAGSVVPAYDMSSIQVLKGPQGTLFGRNTTGGALLVYTKAPTYEWDGYGQVQQSNYSGKQFEGAVNVPLIDDKAAVRIATQITRREGYTRNLGVGSPDLDNRHKDSFRVSLLLEPIENLKSTTVFDYLNTEENGTSAILGQVLATGAIRTPSLAPYFNCGTSVDCDEDLQFERQQAWGPRTTSSNLDMKNAARVWGASNTSAYDFGSVTFKNILAYRESKTAYDNSADGVTMAVLDATHVVIHTQQLSEEMQLLGKLFDDRLDYTLGAFYLKSEPGGPQGTALDTLRPPQVPQDSYPNSRDSQQHFTDTSKAVFAQIAYDLSEFAEGVKFNLGGRYTEDQQKGCSLTTSLNAPLVDPDDCATSVGLNNTPAYVGKVKSNAVTWTVGLDWQIDKDLFGYITSRRGYRGGGFNGPKLADSLSAYQTFKPETLTDVEIGLKSDWSVGDWVGRFNISAYRGKYDDIQGVVTVPPNLDGDNNTSNDPASNQLIVNNSKGTIQGGELSASVSPVQGLTLNLGGAYTDAKKDPGEFNGSVTPAPPFFYTPEWTQNADLRYVVPLGGSLGGEVTASLSYYHVSSEELRDYHAAAYGVANSRIEWGSVGNTALDVGLFVRNLSNREYVTAPSIASNALGFATVAYGEPRIYGIDLRYRFGMSSSR